MKKLRVCIIGHFGAKKHFTDGQTIKTRLMEEALLTYGGDSLRVVRSDTRFCRSNVLRFGLKLIWHLCSCQRIIVMPSKRGRRLLFPVLYLAGRLTRKKIYHCAIGGRLAAEVQRYPRWKKYLNSFQKNWVESRELAQSLQALAIKNAEYLPNFKNLPIIHTDQFGTVRHEPFRFCTFSRVMREKGISDAAEAVVQVNRQYGRPVAMLDVYGPIDADYREELEEWIRRGAGAVRYCGVVAQDQSVGVLKEYFMLLFPTHWEQEGIPGTIIDAYAAGIPVLARQWRYCSEIIAFGKTGYFYPYDHPEALPKWIAAVIQEAEKIHRMKYACVERAAAYHIRTVGPQIVSEVAGKQG